MTCVGPSSCTPGPSSSGCSGRSGRALNPAGIRTSLGTRPPPSARRGADSRRTLLARATDGRPMTPTALFLGLALSAGQPPGSPAVYRAPGPAFGPGPGSVVTNPAAALPVPNPAVGLSVS